MDAPAAAAWRSARVDKRVASLIGPGYRVYPYGAEAQLTSPRQ
jgi:hypothetical protein